MSGQGTERQRVARVYTAARLDLPDVAADVSVAPFDQADCCSSAIPQMTSP